MKDNLLGRYKVMGVPWHGKVTGSSLALPNAATIENTFFAHLQRGAVRLVVPGAPGAVRSPADAALDVLAGRQWRSDVVLWLGTAAGEGYLYGRYLVRGQALYCQAVGNCWTVELPFNMAPTAGYAALANPAKAQRLGRINFAPMAVQTQDVTVSLVGMSAQSSLDSNAFKVMFDSNQTGSATIVGALLGSQPWPARGFGLLKTTGAGTVESPFAVVLEKLSDPNFADLVVYENSMTKWQGVIDWEPSITFDWIDPIDEELSGPGCQWARTTYNSSTMTYDAAGIPSAQTPAVSHDVGHKEARLDGYVIGYWMDAAGVPVPVTLDLRYRIDAAHTGSGSGMPGTKEVVVTPYSNNGGTCTPMSGSYPQFQTAGSYIWTGNVTYTVTESLTVKLKVGGVLIDQHVMVYERVEERTLSGTGPMENFKPGAVTDTNYSETKRFIVDGVEFDAWDDAIFSPSSGLLFGIADFQATAVIDEFNQFQSGGSNVGYWLPGMAAAIHGLPSAIRTQGYGVDHYWWSNRLVCLREKFSAMPSGDISYRYGFTAYPGGATSTRIDSATGAFGVPPVIYGSLNPLSTDPPELGSSVPIGFV